MCIWSSRNSMSAQQAYCMSAHQAYCMPAREAYCVSGQHEQHTAEHCCCCGGASDACCTPGVQLLALGCYLHVSHGCMRGHSNCQPRVFKPWADPATYQPLLNACWSDVGAAAAAVMGGVLSAQGCGRLAACLRPSRYSGGMLAAGTSVTPRYCRTCWTQQTRTDTAVSR